AHDCITPLFSRLDEWNGRLHRLDDALGEYLRVDRTMEVLEQDREFIAAQSGNRIAGARAFEQPAGNDLEQFVTGVMTHRVCHRVELVQVDVHQCGAWVPARTQRALDV